MASVRESAVSGSSLMQVRRPGSRRVPVMLGGGSGTLPHGVRRVRHIAMLAVLGAALPSASALAALEPGVHVDPNSPAGVQYAIPIDRARLDAGGRRTQPDHGSGTRA